MIYILINLYINYIITFVCHNISKLPILCNIIEKVVSKEIREYTLYTYTKYI